MLEYIYEVEAQTARAAQGRRSHKTDSGVSEPLAKAVSGVPTVTSPADNDASATANNKQQLDIPQSPSQIPMQGGSARGIGVPDANSRDSAVSSAKSDQHKDVSGSSMPDSTDSRDDSPLPEKPKEEDVSAEKKADKPLVVEIEPRDAEYSTRASCGTEGLGPSASRVVQLRTPSMEKLEGPEGGATESNSKQGSKEKKDAVAAPAAAPTAPAKEFGPKHPEVDRGETSASVDAEADEEDDEFDVSGGQDLGLGRVSLSYLEDYTPPVIEKETLKNARRQSIMTRTILDDTTDTMRNQKLQMLEQEYREGIKRGKRMADSGVISRGVSLVPGGMSNSPSILPQSQSQVHPVTNRASDGQKPVRASQSEAADGKDDKRKSGLMTSIKRRLSMMFG